MNSLSNGLRRFARSMVLLSPTLVSVVLLTMAVVSYSWGSTLINLACSIQDDSFYYFIPAWNASRGAGYAMGGEITSGFQPLYELLLTAVSYFCNSLEALLRAALTLNGWLFGITALVIGLALARMIRSTLPNLRAASVAVSINAAALSFMCLHTVFFSSITGKENALAALLLAGLIASVFSSRQGGWRSLVVGSLCGLLLLTRIAPSSLAYVAIAILLVQGSRGRIIALVACGLPVVIWGVLARRYFGHALPMSMLVKIAAPNHLSVLHSLKSGFHYLWESTRFSFSHSSKFTVPQLKVRDASRSLLQTALMAAAVGLAFVGLLKHLASRSLSRPIVALLLFDLAGTSCSILFGVAQAGRSDDMYYTVWYVYDLPVLIAVNVGFALAFIQAQVAESRVAKPVTAALALGAMAYFANDIAWYLRLRPYTAEDDASFAHGWQRTEIEAAVWFRDHVAPTNPSYRIIAYSSGALSFYLFDHVVNVDGLANNRAGEAIMADSSSLGYIKASRPDYFIDICRAEPPLGNVQRLHVLAFPQQGNYCIDRFVYNPSPRPAVKADDSTAPRAPL